MHSSTAPDLLSDVFARVALRTSVIASFRLPPAWGLAVPHFGPALLYAVIEGRLELALVGQPPQQAEAGDVILLPAGASHTSRSDEDAPVRHVLDVLDELGQTAWRPGSRPDGPVLVDLAGDGEHGCRFLVVVLDFQDAASNPLRLNLPDLIHLRASENRVTPWLQPAVESIVAGLAQGRQGYVALTTKLAELVFIDAVRSHLIRHPEASGGWLAAMSHPRLARVVAALHRTPEQRWTVAEMARTAGMSRASFAETFARMVGRTPFAFLTEVRMRLAAARIAAGEHSVKSAAHELGYASEKAFSHAFRKAVGHPPGRLKPPSQRASHRARG
jgi:AraC-like DNA-binding protein